MEASRAEPLASPEEVPARCRCWPYRERRREVEEEPRLPRVIGQPPTIHRGMRTEARPGKHITLLVSLSISSFHWELGALFPMAIGYEMERRTRNGNRGTADVRRSIMRSPRLSLASETRTSYARCSSQPASAQSAPIAAQSWVFIARHDVSTVSSCCPAREAVTKQSATSVRNETAMLPRPSCMSVHFLGHDQIVHEAPEIAELMMIAYAS